MVWDVDEWEYPDFAADLVSSTCIREKISKGRKQPLVLHAEIGNAIYASTLESRLEELGVLRFFFKPRVLNDSRTRNRCSDRCSIGLITSASHLHQRIGLSVSDRVSQLVKQPHHHNGIQFVMPQQRQDGQAVQISRNLGIVYERTKQHNPSRWLRSTSYWCQAEVDRVNKPADELDQ